jgi:hypothetical protein
MLPYSTEWILYFSAMSMQPTRMTMKVIVPLVGGSFLFLRKGQGAVAAKSGQTTDIPLSSTESETIWGSNAAMQGAFLKQFLDETRLFKTTSFEMHEDSQPMINAQKRNVSQSRFKHMQTKHHYIRKLIFGG